MTVADALGTTTEVQRYFTDVERHFSYLRGRPLLLAPRDVALVKQWYEAGIPMRVVHKGMERFFAREARRDKPRRQPLSLQFLADDVVELWDEWRSVHRGDDEALPSRDGGADAAAETELYRGRLELVCARLERALASAAAGGRSGLHRVLKRVLREARSWIAELARSGVEDIEERLAGAEKRVLRAARKELDEAELRALRDQVRSEVEPVLGDLDDKAFQIVLRKAEDRAVLTRFGVPRIALFSF